VLAMIAASQVLGVGGRAPEGRSSRGDGTARAPVWRIAWGSAMAWGYGTATNATVRQLATVQIGGSAVRVRISNLYGNHPLVIGAATVGLESTGASIDPGTLVQLTFGGNRGVTIPIGGLVYSDPAPISLTAMETIAVSVFVSDTDLMTVHPCCVTTASYFTKNGVGDRTSTASPGGFVASPWPRLVDAVDVLQSSGNGSIVVLGDSIAEGASLNGSSYPRWTDILEQRIDQLPKSDRRAVVNEAIAANTLTSVPASRASEGGGPSGLSRLARDALDQSGVTEVIVVLGGDDLYFGADAQQVIAGLQQAIAMAHRAGVRIIGATLVPREATKYIAWGTTQQSYLEQVNNWMLTSHAFNGVLNFATTIADVYNGDCKPTAIFPPYNAGDDLHLNAAGQTAIADSVDTTVLGLPAAPSVSPLVAVTPTPGCVGVLGIPSASTPTVPVG
jgi:lysophospholipase L1-like esterase